METSKFREQLLGAAEQEAGAFLRAQAGGDVDFLVVLGSGLARALAETPSWLNPVAKVALSEVPGVHSPEADGHVNELNFYRYFDKTVAVASGRTHLYEGLGTRPVTALVRGAAAAGAQAVLLCNANGCLQPWNLGEVMVIEDHLNFSGASPFDGTFFLDTSTLWDARIAQSLRQVCERRGTYAFLRGPEYQTRAESKLLRSSGVDCVGMSTVLEALMAGALGMKVAGVSVVSDLSFAEEATDPEDVVAAAVQAGHTVQEATRAFLEGAA